MFVRDDLFVHALSHPVRTPLPILALPLPQESMVAANRPRVRIVQGSGRRGRSRNSRRPAASVEDLKLRHGH